MPNGLFQIIVNVKCCQTDESEFFRIVFAFQFLEFCLDRPESDADTLKIRILKG
jgi:hypothetical protein